MRLLILLFLALATWAARAQAPAFAAPDFTALVLDASAAVVALSGGQSLVLPDLPLAEDPPEDDADEEDPGLCATSCAASTARRSIRGPLVRAS